MGHVAVQRRKKLTTRTNRCFLNGLVALNSFSCPISQFVFELYKCGGCGGVSCLTFLLGLPVVLASLRD